MGTVSPVQWARGNFAGDQHQRNDQDNIPRAGTPMHIPMADLMQTAPPRMHTPRPSAPSLHPQMLPSVYHSPALCPHSVLYGVPATPLHTHDHDIAATSFAAPPVINASITHKELDDSIKQLKMVRVVVMRVC